MSIRMVTMLFATTFLFACGAAHGPNDGHDHGDGADHHGADVGESWAVTAWGESFELFPEIDALASGETAGAHVHVTVLDGFTPATEGSVTIVLRSSAGVEERFSSSEVIRPGIFNVEIRPGSPGERELSFVVKVGGVSETIAGGRVGVGSSSDPGGLISQAQVLPSVDGDETVGFLKEQQWRTGFSTAWAEEGELRSSIKGTARVEPPSGGEVILTAPVDGVVRASAWPYTGQSVEAGRAVLTLISTANIERSLAELEASVREIEARSGAADARMARLEILLEREAVSRREVEQARAEATGLEARLRAARAELEAAEAGRSGREGVTGLDIRAPFAGRVAQVLVSPGAHVSAGTTLLRLIRERPVWIRAALTPQDAARLTGQIAGLVLDIGASVDGIQVSAADLRLVAIAPEVDSRTGTVEALIEIERSVDELKPGLVASAQILLPGSIEGLVVPDSAVIDDAGVSVVYIQLDGENFSRREVEVRHRQGQLVLVDGVLPGERVVTLGGAAIRRASLLASGSVEGHVH
jgi:cobalt-zinc-cadmium efflux system membrane fusion protein